MRRAGPTENEGTAQKGLRPKPPDRRDEKELPACFALYEIVGVYIL